MSLESVSSDRPEEPDPKPEGDEAIISMSVAGEVTDSSIMEIGRSRPQFQYTREELMEIKLLPLAKRRPECLDMVYNKCLISSSRGTWDPERWHMDRKRSETPPEEDQRRNEIPVEQNKRRSGDPRERLRKEQDGIVLSPQRRSFNSGCFVNTTQPPPRRPESPIHKPEVPHREQVRRIGSGRLLTRDMWDFRPEAEKLEPERTDIAFRITGNGSREGTGWGESMRDRDNRDRDMRDDRNDRYERRSFGRDFGDRDNRDRNDRHPMDRDKDRRERKFGTDRRRTYSSEPRELEEPEWFSGGPISQHDTIELRGFDDIPEEKITKNKKASPAQKKRGKKGNEKDEKSENTNSAGPKGRSTPTAMDQSINPIHAPHSPISEQEELSVNGQKLSEANETGNTDPSDVNDQSAGKSRDGEHLDFNLDDFLKSDSLPGVSSLLTNGVGADTGSGSRFSQWFKRESPVQDSRRESIQDELLNNLLNDITEPNIQVPSVNESNAYFAPISPANQTGGNAGTGTKLLEMLQRGNKLSQNGQGDGGHMLGIMKNTTSIKEMEVSGKVMHSLEELEARMRGGIPPSPQIEPPRVSKTDEDMSAFKKLLAQVSGGQAVPAANGPIAPKQNTQPITLMQLLKNQPAMGGPPPHQPPMPEQQHPPSFNHVGPLGPAQHPHQAQMQHENLMKVLRIQQQQQAQQQKRQQQTDMLSMMMSGQRMIGASPVPQDMQMLVNNAPSSRELLQRPEAQAIIQGLQQGEITRQHLMQQLQNPAMQHRHREVLVNILKMYGNTTPRTASPHQVPNVSHDSMLQQLLFQQQQRVPSPMNNMMPHRVPSPRDIVMHTQSIIQSALIKTKLEEQRENYRKRQEQQQAQQMQSHQRLTSPVNSPSKQMMSPTPLAFTPTSVLRKMTAEKEPEGSADVSKLAGQSQASQMQQMQSAVQLLAQGLSRQQQGTVRPQPNQQPAWSNQPVKQHHPAGRPIVKGVAATQFPYGGPPTFQSGPPQSQLQQQQQQQPQSQPVPVQQQNQPQRPSTGIYGNPARSKHTMPTSLPPPNVPQYNVSPNSVISQRTNIMSNQGKQQLVQTHFANILQHQQQRNINSQVQLVLNQNYNSNRTDGRIMRQQQQPMNIPMGRQSSPGSNGGSLSPTSNQLARWFSPELLAKARAGKLPELGQTNVLSLEELERLQQASAAVHD
ncbi:eukaryotic translation initiation factor 4E transporter isoform X3 [Fopius arisanus]|uniref:Eukaryotic translation initiation factor 4E transporter isoform X3 n=1 Tax=Fopius arisanus TaxID=64838 RepID=A0A9R1TA16_9HYME|nr:PREDICTED: eukaryotic translation initiation factor 4E transporter isoform X3 [Fopius arisanus]